MVATLYWLYLTGLSMWLFSFVHSRMSNFHSLPFYYALYWPWLKTLWNSFFLKTVYLNCPCFVAKWKIVSGVKWLCVLQLKFLFFLIIHAALIGSSQSWFPTRHEAGGCWPDGATSGVCCYSDKNCTSALKDPLWRLGRWVWPMGWLRITWSLSCGLVSADGVSTSTPSLPE